MSCKVVQDELHFDVPCKDLFHSASSQCHCFILWKEFYLF